PLSSALLLSPSTLFYFFFFTHTPTPAIYTLSLHDALPICTDPRGGRTGCGRRLHRDPHHRYAPDGPRTGGPNGGPRDRSHPGERDRKSTRLNSSHVSISYAVFCLKKKKNI